MYDGEEQKADQSTDEASSAIASKKLKEPGECVIEEEPVPDSVMEEKAAE